MYDQSNIYSFKIKAHVHVNIDVGRSQILTCMSLLLFPEGNFQSSLTLACCPEINKLHYISLAESQYMTLIIAFPTRRPRVGAAANYDNLTRTSLRLVHGQLIYII